MHRRGEGVCAWWGWLEPFGIAYAALIAVLIAVYYLAPSLRPVVVGVVGLSSVSAIAYGLARYRPVRWPAWALIAVAVALLAIGDVVFTVLADVVPGPVTYPAAPDMFYVAAYLPLALGLLWLGRPELPSRDWPMLLDTTGLSLAGSLLVWIVLVRPAVTSLHLVNGGRILAIASWVGYVAVLAASARVVLAWRTNVALRLLGLGVLAFLIADFFYGRQLINGTWSTGSLIDLGFLAFSLLTGAAALAPSMRVVASAPYARHELGPLRLVMVAVALLVAPTVLLVQATEGPVNAGVAIGLVAAAVGVVMVVRLSLSARDYQRRAAREQSMKEAAASLVVATNADDVRHSLGRALDEMLSEPGTGHIRFTQTQHDAVPDPTPIVEIEAPPRDQAELAPTLHALADQAESALRRIDVAARLQADERERYFRSLVLTSKDVTLITQDGRITYATPSATALFGRDVLGASFDSLVHRRQADGRGSVPVGWTNAEEEAEGWVDRAGTQATVMVYRRDLSADPHVRGIVTTLQDVTAERALQDDLAYRATHDQLTGLANAQELADQTRAITRRKPGRGGCAILFIDLDDFKSVNDAYGHATGDRLLVEVARRIRRTIEPDHVPARLGGDEFAVLLPNITGVDAARRTAERLTDALSRPAVIDATLLDCEGSIGIAYTDHPERSGRLMRQADTALYAAKASGKGRWRLYRDDMRPPSSQRARARHLIERAMTSGALEVQYQPIVELATGQPVGFEALLRLHGETPMTPPEIVVAAEDTGLIGVLGEWILSQALTDLSQLTRGGHEGFVTVNISGRQLQQADFVNVVRHRLAVAGIPPERLVLELTESTLVAAEDTRAWSSLADLHHDGVAIAIDDYGTGYASLSYLREASIDIIKLDRSFLDDTGPRGLALIQGITAVFNRIGLRQIAEGVETQAQRDILVDAGCQMGQGFLYAPAMPIEQATAWLRDR